MKNSLCETDIDEVYNQREDYVFQATKTKMKKREKEDEEGLLYRKTYAAGSSTVLIGGTSSNEFSHSF